MFSCRILITHPLHGVRMQLNWPRLSTLGAVPVVWMAWLILFLRSFNRLQVGSRDLRMACQTMVL